MGQGALKTFGLYSELVIRNENVYCWITVPALVSSPESPNWHSLWLYEITRNSKIVWKQLTILIKWGIWPKVVHYDYTHKTMFYFFIDDIYYVPLMSCNIWLSDQACTCKWTIVGLLISQTLLCLHVMWNLSLWTPILCKLVESGIHQILVAVVRFFL